jgi:hypothetical protein
MVLDLMKPYWLAWMSEIITCCSLSAKILVNNLMEEFSKEIGL